MARGSDFSPIHDSPPSSSALSADRLGILISCKEQGCEEKITKYMCDWPGCPNIATEALGCLRELGMFCAVCKEHAPMRPN